MAEPSTHRRRRAGSLAALLLALPLVGSGCRSVSGQPLPEAFRSATYCVERQPRDGRQLWLPIADSLRASGSRAVAAGDAGCTGDFAHIVTFLDHWYFDMRLYLAKLTIEVSDASSGEIVAYGEAKQDSLGALELTHRDVIDRALGPILADR